MADSSAFAGCAKILPAHEGAQAAPVEPLATVSLTAWPGQLAALVTRLRDAFNLDLPQPGHWTQAGALVAVWLGPHHFLLQREGSRALFQNIAPVVADHAALIDLTGARAVLRLGGPDARIILAGLLPIDLHPRVFAPGHTATTVAAHMTVQVRQLDGTPTYDLAVSRSFAGNFWRALELAGEGRLRLG